MASDDFKDLIKQGKNAAQKTEQVVPSKKPKRIPDAIVLFIQRKTCSCGEVYEHPNDCLMYRFGSSIYRISEWHPTYSQVPREMQTYQTHIHACPNCFETTALGEEVVTKREK